MNNRDPSLPLSALTPVERALVSGTPDNDTRDTIRLQILSSGVQTIFVGTGGLPYITDPVIIDGTTQPGFSSGTHMPIIEIDASGAGVNKDGFFAAGLEITGGNSVVKGLIIGGARGEGIRLRIGGGNTIIGNFIGTDFTGTNGDIYGNDSGILILDSRKYPCARIVRGSSLMV